ncbi:hypothetical protein SAMN05421874_12830 [Nonomuraea maritima]|uniref:Uncharacterized protein n=1 Tax=Nonomuraea maritima TaxID=683260 RepID=A0A1G9MHA8_9ACTN|nr:hypothetical protein [Nonomuraea maritima]SDL73381.1 hypothetical protein SAMN05421874_12830 [Nonomuraea maritima]
MFDHSMLPTTPGAIIGYRKSGKPIRLIAGGAPEGEGGGEGQPQGEPQNSGGPEAGVTQPDQQQSTTPDPLNSRQREEQVNPDAIKVEQLPSWAQKLIRETRTEAAEFRNQLRDAQKAADEAAKAKGPSAEEITQQVQSDLAKQIGKALGLIGEEQKELTPEQIIEQLTGERDSTAKERDEERDRHRRALMELAVHRQGLKLGADPDALLDSRSFLKKVRDLDTDADDFAQKLGEVIELAVTENPKFKAGSLAGPPSRSGGEFAGGPGGRAPNAEPSIDDFRKQRTAKKSSQ